MTIPPGIRDGVESTLRGAGLGAHIRSAEPVPGGCINSGVLLETDSGASLFLKWNADAPEGMFEAEADGLTALRGAGSLRVPQPIAWGGADHGTWLLLEFIPAGGRDPASDAHLGHGLAAIHDSATAHGFGWHRDNWIGSLAQANVASASWGEFWRDRRILPQLSLAREAGRLQDVLFDRLLDVTPLALSDVQRPALLHGDLWSGNTFVGTDGMPVLIDPAVYRGDGEVDLAMTELFGGFGASFYDAYAEARGISDAYRAFRRELYQLYYLLVHVNLFGDSYSAGSRRAAERVVSAIT